MLARHTQVAYLLLLSYVILQESSQIKQIPKVLELCERKTNTEASRTFNLLTRLLWSTCDDERIPERGSELVITFYHKLNLTPFLMNIIKGKTSWNIEIRKGIRMKITLLTGVEINEHTGGNRNANKIYWQYRSSDRKNVWDESCMLIFDDSYDRIPKNASLPMYNKTFRAFFNYVDALLVKKDRIFNTLSNKYLLKYLKFSKGTNTYSHRQSRNEYSSKTIKKDMVNMHFAADLQNRNKIELSMEDHMIIQIRLIMRHLISSFAKRMFLLNNLVLDTWHGLNHDISLQERNFTYYLLEYLLNIFYSKDDHDSKDDYDSEDLPAEPREFKEKLNETETKKSTRLNNETKIKK